MKYVFNASFIDYSDSLISKHDERCVKIKATKIMAVYVFFSTFFSLLCMCVYVSFERLDIKSSTATNLLITFVYKELQLSELRVNYDNLWTKCDSDVSTIDDLTSLAPN